MTAQKNHEWEPETPKTADPKATKQGTEDHKEAEDYVKVTDDLAKAEGESKNEISELKEKQRQLNDALMANVTPDKPEHAYVVGKKVVLVNNLSGVRILDAE